MEQGFHFSRPRKGKFKKEQKLCSYCHKHYHQNVPCKTAMATKGYHCIEIIHFIKNFLKLKEPSIEKKTLSAFGTQRRQVVCFTYNTSRRISSQWSQCGRSEPARLTKGGALVAIGKVLNLIKIDVTADPGVMEGMLLVHDIFMHALIDLGATYWFISHAAIECGRLNTKGLREPMGVQSPIGILPLSHRVVPEY